MELSIIITGHCFDRTGDDWQRPSEKDLAKLMQVNFNYQLEEGSDSLPNADVFPVEELLEYRLGRLDFAIIRLGPNIKGESAGDKLGYLILLIKKALTKIIEKVKLI